MITEREWTCRWDKSTFQIGNFELSSRKQSRDSGGSRARGAPGYGGFDQRLQQGVHNISEKSGRFTFFVQLIVEADVDQAEEEDKESKVSFYPFKMPSYPRMCYEISFITGINYFQIGYNLDWSKI